MHRLPKRFVPARRRAPRRRGLVLVFVVLCLIPIMACLALAIDMGVITMAQTQLNDACDAAALAGARTLNGNSAVNNNYSAVTPAAQSIITSSKVLNNTLGTSQLSVNIGRYTYNSAAQQFQGNFPGTAGTNWDLVQTTLSANVTSGLGFSKIFNFTSGNLQAQSAATFRPRDVIMIMDFSGSMRFGSLVGLPYSGARTGSNNMDTNVPTWGAYSSSSANLIGTAPASPYETANITTTTSDGRAPICADFYTNYTGTPAWTPATNNYCTTPGGDNCLKTNKNTTGTYAQTLAQVLNIASPTNSTRDATFESSGYKAYGMNTAFNRYTQGPNYWGKTFFIWPPDPSTGSDGTTNDWRQRYFTNASGGAPLTDNSKLFDSSGNIQTPTAGGYNINYTAILNFISNIGPSIFPAQLQSGRILYYSSIPTTIDTSSWPPTDLNQRFWKDYIDYCLGVVQTGSSSWMTIYNPSNAYAGYGPDYSWGTVKITAQSSLSGSPKPYMNYGDNPMRPNIHFWFGPLSLVDFLGNYNMWYQISPYCSRFDWLPGTCHEAWSTACKQGVGAALTDFSNNHPNDFMSMIMFSVPQSSASDNSGTRFNRVRVALGQNYTYLQDSLWYPPATYGQPTATVTPYDSDNLEIPRPTGGTCYAYPLMLAYNQFSANTSLQTYNPGQPTGDAGGNGRIGAQKIIIFETDGAPNTTASATFVNAGNYTSYYQVRYNSSNPSSSDFPSSINGYDNNDPTVTSQIYTICQQLAAQYGSGGFSTSTHPLLIHCLAFGPLASDATTTLNQMQIYGNVNDGMPAYKIINGTQTQMISNLQTAIGTILQDGVQVSLIQ